MTKYYFYLYPETFFFKGKNKMLLYNVHTRRMLEVDQDNFLLQIHDELQNLENLYSFQLSELHYQKYKSFINKLVEDGFGNMSGTSYSERRVSYPPILKLNHDISSIKTDHQEGQAGYILEYLHEVTIHLAGYPQLNELFYYKQIIYPVKTEQQLDCAKLLKWL